jgi:hypothetical protein
MRPKLPSKESAKDVRWSHFSHNTHSSQGLHCNEEVIESVETAAVWWRGRIGTVCCSSRCVVFDLIPVNECQMISIDKTARVTNNVIGKRLKPLLPDRGKFDRIFVWSRWDSKYIQI